MTIKFLILEITNFFVSLLRVFRKATNHRLYTHRLAYSSAVLFYERSASDNIRSFPFPGFFEDLVIRTPRELANASI